MSIYSFTVEATKASVKEKEDELINNAEDAILENVDSGSDSDSSSSSSSDGSQSQTQLE